MQGDARPAHHRVSGVMSLQYFKRLLRIPARVAELHCNANPRGNACQEAVQALEVGRKEMRQLDEKWPEFRP